MVKLGLTGSGKAKFTSYPGNCSQAAQDQGRAGWRTTMARMLRLMRDEAGATAIEYGLLAALIAVAAITAMQGFGSEFANTFNTASGSMATANSSA